MKAPEALLLPASPDGQLEWLGGTLLSRSIQVFADEELGVASWPLLHGSISGARRHESNAGQSH